MPHSHPHAHSDVELSAASARRARRVLTSLVIPLLLATVVGLVALWPSGETPIGSIPLAGTGMTIEAGTVTDVGTSGPDAELTKTPEVLVELKTGEHAGRTAPVQVPPEILANGVEAGDELRLMFTPHAVGSGSPYVFWDFERRAPIGWLALVYLLAVVAVARWRGLAAVLGLAASLAVILVFVLPAIMLGSAPLTVALVGASAMMFLAVYLAHGISIRTTTALLGTFVGLGITVLLAGWGTDAANLTGTVSDDALMLHGTFPHLDLSDLLLCGIVIAGLGALNDVTITQASAVWELHAANPSRSRRALFTQGMRIGRDHIASTVYTLAFAYVGTALPLLMMASLMDRAPLDTLMAADIAEEIVRTLVSSIGLVLAIPVTTAIAAALVRTSGSSGPSPLTSPDAAVSPPTDPLPAAATR